MRKFAFVTALFLILPVACGQKSVVQPPVTQPLGDPEVVSEEVTYEAGGLSMKGYLAYDKNRLDSRPGILVVHEWWGHGEYVRKRARMLAELGYTALAVDMYGDGKVADHPTDAGRFASEVMSNMSGAKQRFEAALDLLRTHETVDSDRMAAIGYCFGGGVVLHMARMGIDLDGVVSFHGSLATSAPAQPNQVKAKVLVCHGADDPMVKPEHIDSFKKEMAAAQVDYRFESYPGATHAFTNQGADEYAAKFNLPIAYNAEADSKSWQHMQEFFAAIFR
ncbi:MAG: dienelactone hydrolase family protein [Proteobacteria bacterium]|nr:dienelactone hydrolase family protein [Pseudomonadota bacterium]